MGSPKGGRYEGGGSTAVFKYNGYSSKWDSYGSTINGPTSEVLAGYSVSISNDGTTVACGSNEEFQCHMPALDEGLFYTQMAAGQHHTVLTIVAL